MIRFACPSCDKIYKVPDTLGGKAAACTNPNCQTQFLVPVAASTTLNTPVSTNFSLPAVPQVPEVHEVLDAELVAEAPPAINLSRPVMLEPCPGCTSILTVMSEDLGNLVECPFCRLTYKCIERKVEKLPPLQIYPPLVNFSLPTATIAPPSPPVVLGVPIAPCPQCRAELTVEAHDLGRDVECPFCKRVYLAVPPQAKPGTRLARVVRRGPTAQPDRLDSPGRKLTKRRRNE
jgi:hypothetical protein